MEKSFVNLSLTSKYKLKAIAWANSFVSKPSNIKPKSAVYLAGCPKDLARQVQALEELGYDTNNQKIIEGNLPTYLALKNEVSNWSHGPELYKGDFFDVCNNEIGFNDISLVNYDGIDLFTINSLLELEAMMEAGVDTIHRTYQSRITSKTKTDLLKYADRVNLPRVRRKAYIPIAERRAKGHNLQTEYRVRDNQPPQVYEIARHLMANIDVFPISKDYEILAKPYLGRNGCQMFMLVINKK